MNDFVTIVEGPATMRGKGGAVEYLWKGALFIRGRQLSDTVSGGFVCVRARSCSVRGGSASAAETARLAAAVADIVCVRYFFGYSGLSFLVQYRGAAVGRCLQEVSWLPTF